MTNSKHSVSASDDDDDFDSGNNDDVDDEDEDDVDVMIMIIKGSFPLAPNSDSGKGTLFFNIFIGV